MGRLRILEIAEIPAKLITTSTRNIDPGGSMCAIGVLKNLHLPIALTNHKAPIRLFGSDEIAQRKADGPLRYAERRVRIRQGSGSALLPN